MRKLEALSVGNFKSIRDQTLRLEALNVFIGGNGSGKSNLIEVFRFLREIIEQNLAGYTAKKGGADALLHFGRKHSMWMEIQVKFGEDKTSNGYRVGLTGTDTDELAIGYEDAYFHDKEHFPKEPYDHEISKY